MLRPVVILITHQMVNLLLKTHLLNDKRKGMDLLSCVILDIIENSCNQFRHYEEEYFVQDIVD